MDNRKWESDASVNPPNAPAAPSSGYPTDGDPLASIPPTIPGAHWFHQMGEEIRNVILRPGMTPSTSSLTQLRDAIEMMIDAQAGNYALDTGAANAYVVALSPAITAYGEGMTVRVKIANTNTGASTLNAGAGAVPWVNDVGGALAGGDLPAGGIATVTYIASANKFYTTSLVQSQGDARYAALAGLATQVFSALTPAQFDNSTKVATTEFVKKASQAFSGTLAVTGNLTLTDVEFGKLVLINVATSVINLPVSNAGNIESCILFRNNSSGLVTINVQGAGKFYPTGGSGSMTLGPYDTVLLESDGGGGYNIIGGSRQLADAAVFGASLATNGFQKLPNGLIVQWGEVNTSASADVTFTYPIAFPNAVYSISGSCYNGAGAQNIVIGFGNKAASLASIPVGAFVGNTAARQVQVASIIVIGK